MKYLALFLLVFPLLGFSRSQEYVEVAKINELNAHLEKLVAEIRWLYREDTEFISAFELAQKKWQEYYDATMVARFPAKDPTQAYGSVFPIAYAAVKRPIVEARINELLTWTTGTDEGDVSQGSVKRRSEIEAMWKKRPGSGL